MKTKQKKRLSRNKKEIVEKHVKTRKDKKSKKEEISKKEVMLV